MASEVKTNKLSPSTGVTVTLGDASDVFQLPASAEIDIASGATLDVNGTIDVTGATVTGLSAGKVLQVVQSVKTDTASTTVYGGTWADVAGTDQAAAGAIWCVKITPSAATSKILCMFTLSYSAGTATDRRIDWRLLRDSATPVLGDAASSRIPTTVGGTTVTQHGMVFGGYMYLDSPSSTSELTYKVQWDAHSAGNTVYLNRSSADTDTSEYSRATSSITVMEIGA